MLRLAKLREAFFFKNEEEEEEETKEHFVVVVAVCCRSAVVVVVMVLKRKASKRGVININNGGREIFTHKRQFFLNFGAKFLRKREFQHQPITTFLRTTS